MNKKVALLVIDPQIDFCDPKGNLSVKGADQDMIRLSKMINTYGNVIDEIQITLDSHYKAHIAHPFWWVNDKGRHPDPSTLITVEDVEKGKYRSINPNFQQWSLDYVKSLRANNRYTLCIWPYHCIIGSHGQCIDPTFYESVSNWEERFYAIAARTTKGSNPKTEHYSAVKADVEDPTDSKTRLNSELINTLKRYNDILVCGEALSHCVANTLRDIAVEFGDDQVKKIILLEDASSNVTGFEKLGEDFVNDMVAKGMRIAKTTNFFK